MRIRKSKTYWDKADKTERIANLLHEYQKIEATLKRYEDAIDALICCWVGTLYAKGNAKPLGDDTEAIWCPLR